MDTKLIKLITHSSDFHTDDVFACAAISILLEREGKNFEVIRTRDENIIAAGDYVFDVGGVYNPAAKRFDHHQKGGAGTHENGISYAAFGLVWKEYGEQVCGNAEIAKKIETRLAEPIDANDNGTSISSTLFEDVYDYTIGSGISSFIPIDSERTDEKLLERFLEVVSFAKKVLQNEIARENEKIQAREIVVDIYNKTEDKRLIIFPKYYQWKETLTQFPEPVYVISPRDDGTYQLRAVPAMDAHTFANRKDLPASWRGLRDADLEKVTGVDGATFCHNSGFLAGAKTLDGALALAKIALES